MALPGPEVFERAGLKAWPGIEVEWDGSWVRRAAGGYTKRANSLQCFDPADNDNAVGRLAEGIAWFKARGIPPVVRTTPLSSPGLNAVLDAQNWASIDHSELYAMPLGDHEPDTEGHVTGVLDPYFLAAQQALQGYSTAQATGLRNLVAVMEVPAIGIVIERDGVAVASGLMAIADGIVVAGNVIADKNQRRQGLGAAMMHTGLSWARKQGATIAALNVQADNVAGKALYRSLGYSRQYDYFYRVPA